MVALKKLGADLSGHGLSMDILVLYMQRQKLQVVGLCLAKLWPALEVITKILDPCASHWEKQRA